MKFEPIFFSGSLVVCLFASASRRGERRGGLGGFRPSSQTFLFQTGGNILNEVRIELVNEKKNEKTSFVQKVGSNFQIKSRTVFFEPHGAWKNLLDPGIFGGNAFVSRLRRPPLFRLPIPIFNFGGVR